MTTKKTTSKKTEKQEFEHFDSIAKMTPAQYWEWRTTVEELEHSKTKGEMVMMEIKICDREAAVIDKERKLKVKKYQDTTEKYDKIKTDYEGFKRKLEDELGINMNNTVICPYTFEIRKLTDDSSTKEV